MDFNLKTVGGIAKALIAPVAPVPVLVETDALTGQHHLNADLVTAIDPRTDNVTIRQSWGAEETMTAAQFRTRF